MPIVGLGSPILRQVCFEAVQSQQAKQVALDLICTLEGLNTAVGLAAPQINSDLKMFVMKQSGIITTIINPVIIKSDLTQTSMEGCMSIPGIKEYVKRPDKIEVEYYDINWNKVKQKLRGFPAVIFQHELDHLHGILYIDRLDPKKQEEIRHKLEGVQSGRTTTYYPMIFPNSPFVNDTNV